jgi:hypothetical protein
LSEKSTMRLSQRLIAAAVLIAISGALAGCSGGGGISSFDPSDMLDWLDTKKKLEGNRKPVFPEGVPGLEQGVPRDLYKGASAQDQQNAQAAAAPAPPPEAPKQAAKRGKKNKPPAAASTADPNTADPNAAPDANASGEAAGDTAAAPPAPKPKKIVRKRTTAPPPDQQAAQPAPSAAPPAAATAQQQSAAPFPAPMPSNTFSR